MTERRILLPRKHDRLIVLGVTGRWAFAAGVLLRALRRFHPSLQADILLFHDATLRKTDKDLLSELGAVCVLFSSRYTFIPEALLSEYSPLCFAKFSCFSLLSEYPEILWLDADCVVQDSLDEIWSFGPLALAREDVYFYENNEGRSSQVNMYEPVEELDANEPNLNSGVLRLGRELLPHADFFQSLCLTFLQRHAPILRYPDQAALNMLAQHVKQHHPCLWQELPSSFNCHPRNPASLFAPLVHAFGAYKLWNDGVTQACFPEWQRDYAHWTQSGGSAWDGDLENPQFSGVAPFSLLGGLYKTLEKSDRAIADLSSRLGREEKLRKKFESLLQRVSIIS